MELQLIEKGSKTRSKVEVADGVFNQAINEGLIHQAMVAYQAAARQGSVAQKTRAEVRGGGAKPWRQKGTGRARAGTRSSPIWRSGGVTFAAKPRDYTQKINKKMYRKALGSLMSALVAQERLIALQEVNIDTPKTKAMAELTASYQLEGSILIVAKDVSEALYLSSRNLKHVAVLSVQQVDLLSLLHFDNILMTVDAIKYFEEYLA